MSRLCLLLETKEEVRSQLKPYRTLVLHFTTKSISLSRTKAAWKSPAPSRKRSCAQEQLLLLPSWSVCLFPLDFSAKSQLSNFPLGATTASRAEGQQPDWPKSGPMGYLLQACTELGLHPRTELAVTLWEGFFFFFTCYFTNNITMQHYTQDHSFTRDAQRPKRPAARSLLCQGRGTIPRTQTGKPQTAKTKAKSDQRLPQNPAPSSTQSPWTRPKGAMLLILTKRRWITYWWTKSSKRRN